ncbi:ATP-dependent metallopeptidase FtsH/Yme1/Tma family protein [Deinococcus grandis]|uniref:ATP-dependent metallopeptidase FtsH/Yme1/Tma family protein n=1 Tax=Deinococcus grandis TaxID=57498 RepID=UPI000B174DBD|nr:ATP-dependent metallopeptidase FtsH/Yme1/Tma family protein [Deinococcus grandis]
MTGRGGRRVGALGVPALGVLGLVLLAALGVWGLTWWSGARVQVVPLAEFRSLLEAGQVARVVVRGETATVTLKQGMPVQVLTPGGPSTRDVREVRVRVTRELATPDASLISLIQQQRVDLRVEQPSQWPGILLNVLPVLLLVGWTGAVAALLVWLGWWAARRVKVANP